MFRMAKEINWRLTFILKEQQKIKQKEIKQVNMKKNQLEVLEIIFK